MFNLLIGTPGASCLEPAPGRPCAVGALLPCLLNSLLIAIGLLCTVPLMAAEGSGDKRPNIVYVMVDDQRFDQLSYMGHPYLNTPNIDRLAAEGARFSRAYVNTPLCGPSRGSLFTGRLAGMHRIVNHVVWPGRYPKGDFMPGVMKEAGYATAIIGKWGMGTRGDPRPEFDKWFVDEGLQYPDSLQDRVTQRRERREYYDEHLYQDQRYRDGPEMVTIEGYLTDILFDEAIEFCARDADEPFIAMITPHTPHSPYNPAARHKGLFNGKGLMDAKTRDLEKGFEQYPNLGRNERLLRQYESQCEMMLSIDEGVGRLYAALEQAGKLDNTIFIYTSDNGFMWGEHGHFHKAKPWEESVKVPLVIRYPAWFKPGTEIDELITLTDFSATFVAIAGGPELKDAYGVDMVPFFTNKVDKIRDEVVTLMYDQEAEQPMTPVWSGVIEKRYKYTAYSDGTESLMFDLQEDPHEEVNLANDPAMADKRVQMVARLKEVLSENGTPADWVK